MDHTMECKAVSSEDIICFTAPFKAIFVGASSCGKSELIAQILEHKDDLIDKPNFDYIAYCYPGKSLTTARQEYVDRLSKVYSNLEASEGLPDIDDLLTIDGQKLIIIDDLYGEAVNSQHMHDLMTIHAHHSNISLMITAQNYFTQGKFSKTLQRNYTNTILFDAKIDRQMLDIISSQMFPRAKHFIPKIMEWLRIYVPNVHKRYIWIDSHPMSKIEETLRVRSNIIPFDEKTLQLVFEIPKFNLL